MDHTAELGVLAGVLIPLGMFAMIFGIVYLYKRERMAMIERGMDPRSYKPRTSTSYHTLTSGLLLIGAGLGLFLAYVLDHTCFASVTNEDNPAIYFALIAIFGGSGLFLSHVIEKRDEKKAGAE